MLMRECPICGKFHRQGEKCPNAKAGQKEYDMLHRNREGASFYHSSQWKRMQALVKAACHGLDMYAFYVEHRLVKGRIAHHIIPISQEPGRALDMGNLIYVSDSSHKKIHDAYSESDEDKKIMQKKLFSINKKIFHEAEG